MSTYENFKAAAGKLIQSSSWRNRALLKPSARSLLSLPQCQSRTAADAAASIAAAAGNAYCAGLVVVGAHAPRAATFCLC